VAVADIHHPDAACEVDVAASGDVPELRPFGVIGDDRMCCRDAAGDVAPAQLGQLCLLGLGCPRLDAHATHLLDPGLRSLDIQTRPRVLRLWAYPTLG